MSDIGNTKLIMMQTLNKTGLVMGVRSHTLPSRADCNICDVLESLLYFDHQIRSNWEIRLEKFLCLELN